MKIRTLVVALSIASLAGCSGAVEETDDSVRLEGELPKVETGPAPVDLDPATDDDVDIDTPAAGDT
jgi:hypothetical protein